MESNFRGSLQLSYLSLHLWLLFLLSLRHCVSRAGGHPNSMWILKLCRVARVCGGQGPRCTVGMCWGAFHPALFSMASSILPYTLEQRKNPAQELIPGWQLTLSLVPFVASTYKLGDAPIK